MRQISHALVVVLMGLALVSPAAAQQTAKSATPGAIAGGKPCQGTLQIAGKTYKLEHVVAYETKIFDDMGIAVLLSDKAIAVDKLKAALREDRGSDDHFNVFQPHVKITFNKSGEASFCNAWAANTSISVAGSKLKGELVSKDGRVRGKATMDYGDEPGEPKNGFELQFDTPLIVTPLPPEPKTVAKTGPQVKIPKGKPAPAEPAEAPHVRDLPIPKDATNVEFKELVEHIGFETPADVKATASALAKKLGEQGWTSDDSDLVTPKSAILKREQGDASLTIFVKPSGTGSKVTIMSSGLSWEERK